MSERARTRARIRNVTQRVTRRACLLRPFNYSNRYRSRLAPAPANSREEEAKEENGPENDDAKCIRDSRIRAKRVYLSRGLDREIDSSALV